MKKRFVLMSSLILLLVLLFPLSASADTGPKPSVNIDITGLEGEKYFVTLLSESETHGPWSTGNEYADWNGDRAAWDKFKSVDGENMHFLGYFEDCTETNSFAWTYYPPDEFKIAVYLPGSDEVLISEELERYAFDSFYTVAVTENGTLTVSSSETEHIASQVLAFAARLIITIAVELALAACFLRLCKRNVLIIVLVNVATQGLLNYALMSTHMNFIFTLIFYAFLELAVFGTEGLVYALTIRRGAEEKPKTWLYALTANLASYAVGIALSYFIPSIF